VLLPPLTNLAAAEETVVREAAVKSIISVLASIQGSTAAGIGIFKVRQGGGARRKGRHGRCGVCVFFCGDVDVGP
jgi:hypothetical protein